MPAQQQMFETEEARSLLDQLLADSRLYTRSADYKALLDFVVRLRNFALFNAMLLQVQKPGLTYAASAYDWRERFGRRPTEGARPLLILWPFGPVVLVYDVLDTEGDPLPEDVASCFARGGIDQARIAFLLSRLEKRRIECRSIDAGDGKAGSISVVNRGAEEKEPTLYRMQVNRNHSPNVQFATVAHELGHLFLGHLLGHLGPDKVLNCTGATVNGTSPDRARSRVGFVPRVLEKRRDVEGGDLPRVLRRPEHDGRRNRPVSDHACGRPDRDPAGSDGSDELQMSESYAVTGALPDLVVAADWSTVETKRWMVRGERVGDGYVVPPPEPVGDHKSLMARLRRALPDDHRLLIGFDFPIGLPVEYAQKASVGIVPGPFSGRWSDAGSGGRFYQISDLPSLRQPFFPLPKQLSRATSEPSSRWRWGSLNLSLFGDAASKGQPRGRPRSACSSLSVVHRWALVPSSDGAM